MNQLDVSDEHAVSWLVVSWLIIGVLCGVIGLALGMLLVAVEYELWAFVVSMRIWMKLMIVVGLVVFGVGVVSTARRTLALRTRA